MGWFQRCDFTPQMGIICCVDPAKYTSALDGPRPVLPAPGNLCPVCDRRLRSNIGWNYVYADNCPKCKLFWPYHYRGHLVFPRDTPPPEADVAFYKRQVLLARDQTSSHVSAPMCEYDVHATTGVSSLSTVYPPAPGLIPQTASRLQDLLARRVVAHVI